MGLPDSGHGSSLRRSNSDIISKGIRKSSRKAAKPSSALKKLRFGDEVPDMLPAPEIVISQGESDISISPSKGQLGFALVGKFSHSIPSPFSISKALGNIKLIGSLTWKFLNYNHILISLSESSDYVKLLNGVNDLPVWFINGCPMRMFTWTPTFHPSKETPVVAIWCKLPGLPVHLYDHSALFKIGSLLGKPLQIDYATAHRERASFARICVEIDLTKHVPDSILLDINDLVFNQRVIYENLPKFCVECNHVGHSVETCYAKGNNPRPPRKMDKQPGIGIQQGGNHNREDGLGIKNGGGEMSSDGFQKVAYRRKQIPGQLGKTQQDKAVQPAGSNTNRFVLLTDDMDVSDQPVKEHTKLVIIQQNSEFKQQHQQQGKGANLKVGTSCRLTDESIDMDTSDAFSQYQLEAGGKEDKQPIKSHFADGIKGQKYGNHSGFGHLNEGNLLQSQGNYSMNQMSFQDPPSAGNILRKQTTKDLSESRDKLQIAVNARGFVHEDDHSGPILNPQHSQDFGGGVNKGLCGNTDEGLLDLENEKRRHMAKPSLTFSGNASDQAAHGASGAGFGESLMENELIIGDSFIPTMAADIGCSSSQGEENSVTRSTL